MRRLPPLNGIRAFEAAARTGGFTAAGRELGVSPAAVSRLVHLLEARLGTPLFHRRANALTPTEAGRAYATGLTPILDALAALTERAAQAARPVLTIGAGPSFAARWLIPRLAGFQAAHPGIEVRIATGGVAAPFAEDWTCGIRLATGPTPGFVSEPLFAAELRPVCTPALARRLRTPAALAAVPLLRVRHAPEDWPAWLAAAGQPHLRARGPEFDWYAQAQQAACDGLGVTLGLRPYADDDLRARRLVAPFALSIPKGAAWHLVHRPARAGDPALEAFRAWLRAEIAPPTPKAKRTQSRES